MTLRKRFILSTLITMLAVFGLMGWTLIELRQIQSYNEDYGKQLVEVSELETKLLYEQAAWLRLAEQPSKNQMDQASSLSKKNAVRIKALKDDYLIDDFRVHVDRAAEKYSLLNEAVPSLLAEQEPISIRSHAARIEGVLSDLNTLHAKNGEFYGALQAEAKDKTNALTQNTLFVSILLLLALAIYNWLFARSIVRPIDRIVRIAEKISDGDLSEDFEAAERNDEIGRLERSISRMNGTLRDVIISISSTSNRIYQMSEKASAENENVVEVSGNMTQAIHDMAGGTQTVSDDLQSAVGTITELRNLFAESEKRTNAAFADGKRADATMRDSVEVMEQQAGALAKAAVQGRSLSDQMARFLEQTEQIERMAELVEGVAAQTNLLSLNAAIEAARAGDAGRGFGVVASEVKKLAEETNQATRSIFSLVRTIRGDGERLQQLLAASVDEQRAQISNFNEMKQSFLKTREDVSRISETLSYVSSQMVRSKGEAESVVAQVGTVSGVMEEIAAGNEEVAASMRDQQASFENIYGLMRDLEKTASVLEQETNHFQT
ncbi:methyl-accepting chemotaxis protein [Exiguobacterium flavidum]|uniref:methyl-accepting chemotaxis protein n=1 Tax=Exiguobacterium flavidum TaxID=2184695 RepID=UPI000DF7D62C|nr:methyl-accepting chemotaxis protein [Exiguobacterium flavidum]